VFDVGRLVMGAWLGIAKGTYTHQPQGGFFFVYAGVWTYIYAESVLFLSSGTTAVERGVGRGMVGGCVK